MLLWVHDGCFVRTAKRELLCSNNMKSPVMLTVCHTLCCLPAGLSLPLFFVCCLSLLDYRSGFRCVEAVGSCSSSPHQLCHKYPASPPPHCQIVDSVCFGLYSLYFCTLLTLVSSAPSFSGPNLDLPASAP